MAGRDRANLRRASGAQQLRYVSKKYWSADHPGDARHLHRPTVAAAEVYFAEFADTWRDLSGDDRLVGDAWNEFVPFLEFPAELRKIVYTTNAIETLNARFRRAVRHRGHFPNEQAALKVLYLVAKQTTTQP